MVQGFLNLDKPLGLTSHDCVARVRRLLQLKRVGHGGTLDPAATGVLPMALGRATRLLQFLQSEKAYRATIRLGVRTTTDDSEGEVIGAEPVPWLTQEMVEKMLPQFEGTIQQIPPQYSAIQVGGKRLYDLARSGQPVEVPVRAVKIDEIRTLNWRPGDFPELDVAIACGAGTYIRAIARDLGEALQVGGTLAALVRTNSSGFRLEQSITLEALAHQLQHQQFQPIAPEVGLSHLKAIALPPIEAKRWCQGQKIPVSAQLDGSDQDFLRVKSESGEFLGISQRLKIPEGMLLIPKVVVQPA